MADLLGGARKYGRNLLDIMDGFAMRRFEPQYGMPVEEELAGPAGVSGLRDQYDSNFMLARDQALRSGQAAWYNMNEYGHAGAQNAYTQGLDLAQQKVAALREERERARRQSAVAEQINRLAGLAPDDEDYLSAADAELLRSLSTDESAKTLIEHQFPALAGGALGATAGVLSYVNGDDGHVYAMMRDGTTQKTPVRWDQSTSATRTIDAFQNDPTMYDVERRRKFAQRYGGDSAAAQAEAEITLPGVIQSSTAALDKLNDLKSRIGKMETGRIEGKVREQFDAEFQAINAELNELALLNIAALSARGVRLNPITENELRLLMSTSAQISNEPEANIAILNSRINGMQKIIDEAYALLDWVDAGRPILQYRPQTPGRRKDPASVQPLPPPGTVPAGNRDGN